ncbi:pas pac sensor hybrid histidine kinase [Stylonychia lemnae]|uniref:histidine kinase n=1 Tax=Stylonychia lemnae TaxID=5949 RepID=A0A078B0E1_STYLE|nr:pas pac sensor hybrid histidine kinase [Stylonychia lemnae]|eukprot:CDW87979.1 pas pac sensor hybrid histidine kinase [Stylonychia lemnae]
MFKNKLDNTSQDIIKTANVIVSTILFVRVIGAGIDYYREVTQKSESKEQLQTDYMSLNESTIDLALALVGNILMIIYTILMFAVKRWSFMLQFAPEIGILTQFISFPYYDLGGGASLMIQYMSFQIITIYIISNQLVLVDQFDRKNLLKRLPLIIIYGIAQFYIFQRSFKRDLIDFFGNQTIYLLLMSIMMNLLVIVSSFVLQIKRMNRLLYEKDKNTVLTQDYQRIIDNFAEGILIANEQGKISYINQQLKSFIEYTENNDRSETLNKKIFKAYYLHAESQEEEKWLSLMDIIQDQNMQIDEQDRYLYRNYFELVGPDSQSSHESGNNLSQESQNKEDMWSVEVQKFNIQFNRQDQMLIIIKNISSIINYEKHKNDSKYQQLLLASVSHEMLTPLNSIINLSSIIRRKFENSLLESSRGKLSHQDDTKSIKLLENASSVTETLFLIKIVHNSAILMHYLIQDFIDLKCILTGKLEQNNQNFDLQRACFEILELFEIQIKSKNLTCTFEISLGTPSSLYFDAKKYQQIILNLIQNAVKFTQQGGFDIFLDFKRLQSCPTYGCGTLITSIKDTGQGMDEDAMRNLFQIFGNFKRVSDEGIIRSNGVGLGLSICKELVNFLGGQICCDSQQDQGSKFQFSINIMCKQCRAELEQQSAQKSHKQQQTQSDAESSLFQFKGTNIKEEAYEIQQALNDSRAGLILHKQKTLQPYNIREPSKTPKSLIPIPNSFYQPNTPMSQIGKSKFANQMKSAQCVISQNPYMNQPTNPTKKKIIFGDKVQDLEQIIRMKSIRKNQRPTPSGKVNAQLQQNLTPTSSVGFDQLTQNYQSMRIDSMKRSLHAKKDSSSIKMPTDKQKRTDISRTSKSSQFMLQVKVIDFSDAAQSSIDNSEYQQINNSKNEKKISMRQISKRQSDSLAYKNSTFGVIQTQNDNNSVCLSQIYPDLCHSKSFGNHKPRCIDKTAKSAIMVGSHLSQIIQEQDQEDCSSSSRLTMNELGTEFARNQVYQFNENQNNISLIKANQSQQSRAIRLLNTIQEEPANQNTNNDFELENNQEQYKKESDSKLKLNQNNEMSRNNNQSFSKKNNSNNTLIQIGIDSKYSQLFQPNSKDMLDSIEKKDKNLLIPNQNGEQMQQHISPSFRVKAFDRTKDISSQLHLQSPSRYQYQNQQSLQFTQLSKQKSQDQQPQQQPQQYQLKLSKEQLIIEDSSSSMDVEDMIKLDKMLLSSKRITPEKTCSCESSTKQ